MRTETDLGRVIHLVLKGWKLVVTLTVLFALCAFLYAEMTYVPTYTSLGKIRVQNRSMESQTVSGGVTATDITASSKLVNTCIDIMKHPQFLERVRAQIEDPSYAAALSLNKINLSAADETEMLHITVTDTNPYRAQLLVDAILTVAPVELKEQIQSGEYNRIYKAEPAKLRSNNRTVKVMGGALLGLILSVLFILLTDLFNTTVNSSEEISQHYGLPVLGNIPDVGKEKKRSKKEAAYQ